MIFAIIIHYECGGEKIQHFLSLIRIKKNYNVRDDSDWEKTLKPRLHNRIKNSKNIILFLSSVTKNSRALREEIDYGINTCGLPVIVVYPDFCKRSDIVFRNKIRKQITDLWDKLPVF